LRCRFSLEDAGGNKDNGVVVLGRRKVVLEWRRKAELIREYGNAGVCTDLTLL
jgi:hypothetical protein